MSLFAPRSLSRRILLGEVLAVTLVAVLLPVLLMSALHAATAREERAALRREADMIAGRLHWRGDRLAIDHPGELEPGYATAYDGRAFAVTDDAGRVRLASRYAGGVPWRRIAPQTVQPRFVGAEDFALYVRPVAVGGRGLRVMVAQDRSQPGVIVDDIERAFLIRIALVMPVLLLLPVLSGLAMRRTVHAVRRASGEAEAIQVASLGVPIAVDGLPAEMRPLVAAANGLVERVRRAFFRQAEFVGNVVHELRTPLQTLALELDALPDPALRQRCAMQVERLSHVVTQLRDLATLDEGEAMPWMALDLAAVATETVTRMAPAVIAGGHHLAFAAADGEAVARVRGNATLIDLAIANLIGNAAKHTPAGCTIMVSVRGDGAGTVVEVADDGPGIACTDPGDAQARYWRADHARSDSAGLGLAIVTRIMERHGGRLLLAVSGGTRATLRFPAAIDGVPCPTNGASGRGADR